MKNPLFQLLVVAAVLVSLAGCTFLEMPEKMDDLSKSTNDMSRDTTKLSNQTADVLLESQKLAQLTATLLKASRQGVSQEQRVRAYQEFIRPDYSFEVAAKNAAVYFRGFEFQLWENTWYDTPASREALFATAVEEFMVTFRGLIGKRVELEPLKMNAETRPIFAMAETLEQVNDLQVEAAFKNKFQIVSMLDLIFASLDQKRRLEENPNIGPKFAEKLLQYEDEAKYLLQQRYSIYLTVMLDKLLGLSQLDTLEKMGAVVGSWFGSPLIVDLSKVNALEIKDVLYKYLYGALYEKNKMAVHGGVVESPMIADFLDRIVWIDDPSAAVGKKQLTKNLKQAFSQILCTSPSCKIISDKEIESVATDIKFRAEAPFSPEYASQADSWMKLQIRKRVNDALEPQLELQGKKDYEDFLNNESPNTNK
jgi:hypothetical protein